MNNLVLYFDEAYVKSAELAELVGGGTIQPVDLTDLDGDQPEEFDGLAEYCDSMIGDGTSVLVFIPSVDYTSTGLRWVRENLNVKAYIARWS